MLALSVLFLFTTEHSALIVLVFYKEKVKEHAKNGHGNSQQKPLIRMSRNVAQKYFRI